MIDCFIHEFLKQYYKYVNQEKYKAPVLRRKITKKNEQLNVKVNELIKMQTIGSNMPTFENENDNPYTN